MSDPLFYTITSADWKRAIALSRREPNPVREQIRETVATIETAGPVLTPDQLHILQHSLGCDEYGRTDHRRTDEGDGCFGYYRNRYVSDPEPTLVALCNAGLMEDRGAQNIAGGMHYYRVTDAGRRAMILRSPKRPKISRSQQRYLDFLNADNDMTFIEYLRAVAQEKKRGRL